MKKVNCYIPFLPPAENDAVIKALKQSPRVDKIRMIGVPLHRTSTLKDIAISEDRNSYTLLCTGYSHISWQADAFERVFDIAEENNIGILYADHYRNDNGTLIPCPSNDYQQGSVRDDFDFGPILIVDSSRLIDAVNTMENNFLYAALYDLRLRISENASIYHINEFLYSEDKEELYSPEEKMFDYVNPRNRSVQVEMETAFTSYLKRIKAWLAPYPEPETIDYNKNDFPVEASIVIPVRNRAKTIVDAIHSALSQETNFSYNVIVVDNHSDDGTTDEINNVNDERLIHLIPEQNNLGIGGCWNIAINHSLCGRYTVQLDSDDLYSSPTSLQRIIDTLHSEHSAMLVGTYQMVNFELKNLPPGIIDHREWTEANGRNNALRVNGFGAPRAFFTPIIRAIGFPNVSYGEDYAVCLNISRRWKVSRIYDVLYLCRRWEGNSDASPSIEVLNKNNNYKDSLRSLEISARIQLNQNVHD